MSNWAKKIIKTKRQRCRFKVGDKVTSLQPLMCSAYVIDPGTELTILEKWITDYTICVGDDETRWMTEVDDYLLCTKEEWETHIRQQITHS